MENSKPPQYSSLLSTENEQQPIILKKPDGQEVMLDLTHSETLLFNKRKNQWITIKQERDSTDPDDFLLSDPEQIFWNVMCF